MRELTAEDFKFNKTENGFYWSCHLPEYHLEIDLEGCLGGLCVALYSVDDKGGSPNLICEKRCTNAKAKGDFLTDKEAKKYTELAFKIANEELQTFIKFMKPLP